MDSNNGDSPTSYVKMRLSVYVPQMCDHSAKNPFLKECKSKGNSLVPPSSGEFMVRCGSLYKSHLKNKTWEVKQVQKPDALDPLNTSEILPESSVTEESKDGPTEADAGVAADKDKVGANWVDHTWLLGEFRVISQLPRIRESEIERRRVELRGSLPASRKTLILDLDGTLVHTTCEPLKGDDGFRAMQISSSPGGPTYFVYIKVRPFARYFLEEMAKHYELVAFTSAEQEYANTVVYTILDPGHELFSCVLHRAQCIPANGNMIKDLRVIGNRELKNVVIVDNSVVSFCAQINNGVPVTEYLGSDEDTDLRALTEYLKDLASKDNVRSHIHDTFFLHDMYDVYMQTQSKPRKESIDQMSND